jgi:hypothetical protein
MSAAAANPGLLQALELSRDILQAAERADLPTVGSLDVERMRLVQSFRRQTSSVAAADGALLQEIAQLNDQAIGLLEHRRRGKGRELDMAAVGRRALAAYSSTR